MRDRPAILADFPILSSLINGHPLAYLDNANTSLTPEPVIRAMDEYYRSYNANIHRGFYPFSERATAEHEGAREKVRIFLGAKSVREIIFIRNATEAINLVAHAWGSSHIRKGDGILLSLLEHHSNVIPWQLLQARTGCRLFFVAPKEDGRINLEKYQNILKKENIKMVAMTHVSNALGVVNPICEMARMAHEAGALILVDGAQAAPHVRVDVQALDADFYAFTGHKLYGPTGIGVLYGREVLLREMPPFLGGGEMIETVSTSGSTWAELPYKYEAGTPNIAGAIGLGAAIDYVSSMSWEEVQKWEHALAQETLDRLLQEPDLTLFGPRDMKDRTGLVSFSVKGIHPHDIASLLGEKGICVRAGHHCAQPLMDFLGVPATLRLSLAFYNTREDVDLFFQGLHEVKKLFQR